MLALALSLAMLQTVQPRTEFPFRGPTFPILLHRPCSPEPSDATPFIFAACFYESDYPAEAYRAREQGTVGVRVVVGADGNPTDCTITASSGSALLDRSTCAWLMTRIRGANGYDAENRPIAITLSGRVAWVLPAAPPPPYRKEAALGSYFSGDDYPASALRGRAEGVVSYQVDVDAEGSVTACQVTRSSGSAALDAATCRILRTRARYVAARDSEGLRIPGIDYGAVGWRLAAAA
jgi:TonB family protein